MSASKSKYEHREILNFSTGKVTKNSILRSLRKADFIQEYYNESGISLVYVNNEIKIGMYKICFDLNVVDKAKKLKQYGKFGIYIYEGKSFLPIDLDKDSRFRSQPWIHDNRENKLTMSRLTDIILYCKRLDKLKSFL